MIAKIKCKICNKKTEHIESHHIIPVSRGGSNKKNNMISLCSDCHGLAHDVSFKNDRGGLIKEGVIKSKLKDEEAIEWLKINEKKVNKKMNKLFENNINKYNLLILLLENGQIYPIDLKDWYILGKFTKKITI